MPTNILRIVVLFFTTIVSSTTLYFAQPLSAYYDNQNQFFSWDNGMTRKIDYLQPVQYKVGRLAIPYLDNSRNFKIYSQGATQIINNGNTSSFFATDYLVAFLNAKILFVWEKGKITKLSNYVENYYVGDSVLMFFDKIQNEFKVYYNEDIYVLEDFMVGLDFSVLNKLSEEESQKHYEGQDVASGQIPMIQVSDNIAAYVNFAEQFKVFYQGEMYQLDDRMIKSFGVGRNIVAYTNAMNEFKIFYNGEDNVIDNFIPYEYQVGDELVAFVSSDNYFKIHYQDSTYVLGYFQPEYNVKDNIVYYKDQSGYFNVFYKGKNYVLENYWPDGITAQYHSVAYISRNKFIKLFTEGQIYEVINADVPYWRLDYDVLHYRFGTNLNKVFYKGRTY